jgi:hypothetical protein
VLHVRINIPPVPEAIEAVAEGLVRLNEWMFERADIAGVESPSLYDSGIRYRREPQGREWWESAADAHGVATDRSGDCEDLAAYRCAELRVYEDDPDAMVRVIRTRRGSFHAIVQRGDGSYEDPSRILLEQEQDRKASR